MSVSIKNTRLRYFVNYAEELENTRKFARQKIIDKFFQPREEDEVLFQEIKNLKCLSADFHSKMKDIGKELAEIFLYLCIRANLKNIDLATGFPPKEGINKLQTWKKLQHGFNLHSLCRNVSCI